VSGDTSPPYWSNWMPKRPNSPDTCRVLVMPRVLRTVCHVSPPGWPTSAVRPYHVICTVYHMSPPSWPTSVVRTCHVCCTDVPHGLYGLYSHPPFFACLPFRTERDIFSIRTPFDEVNIPPESGRRDGRNGTSFVAFRALSFLSIFQALSGFWIRFRIMKT
jgi:hypothetical protein